MPCAAGASSYAAVAHPAPLLCRFRLLPCQQHRPHSHPLRQASYWTRSPINSGFLMLRKFEDIVTSTHSVEEMLQPLGVCLQAKCLK
jgi:hypothetical protein